MMKTEIYTKLKNAVKIARPALLRSVQNVRRLFPAYLLSFFPFVVFGTRNDIRLMFWKVAVVGAGLLIFHFTRKAMFPYIDIRRSLDHIRQPGDGATQLARAVALLAESMIIAAMAFAIIIAMAEGL